MNRPGIAGSETIKLHDNVYQSYINGDDSFFLNITIKGEYIVQYLQKKIGLMMLNMV